MTWSRSLAFALRDLLLPWPVEQGDLAAAIEKANRLNGGGDDP
jgi:hypothetical protein